MAVGVSRAVAFFVLLILATSISFGFIATFSRHWITNEKEPDALLTLASTATVVSEDLKLRVGIWWFCLKYTDAGDDDDFDSCRNTLTVIESIDDQWPAEHNNKFARPLIQSVRAVRAMVILGDIFSIMAGLVVCGLLIATKTNKLWTGVKMIGAVLSFLAFAAYITAWIVWLVQTRKLYIDDDTPNWIELKCDKCNFGYSFWFCLVAWITALTACIILYIAPKPHYEQPIVAPRESPVYIMEQPPLPAGMPMSNGGPIISAAVAPPPPIYVPPPAPVYVQQPMSPLIIPQTSSVHQPAYINANDVAYGAPAPAYVVSPFPATNFPSANPYPSDKPMY